MLWIRDENEAEEGLGIWKYSLGVTNQLLKDLLKICGKHG